VVRGVAALAATLGVMGARPRVVFLTDIATPYMVAVLEELAQRVDLAVLFCARTASRGGEWAFDRPFGFRHKVLRGPAIPRRSRDAADLYPNPAILAALSRERPDAVISGAFSFPSLLAALYGRVSGAPLVIHSDGTSYSERNLDPLQRLARRILVRELTVCVGNSQPAVERFLELGVAPDRVFRAPHATDVAPFHAVARTRNASQPGSTPMTILHVGRLIRRKGIDRLLRAVAEARSRVALRLVLVGRGPEEGQLRRLAADLGLGNDVEFRGFVDQPELPEVYAQADVFAFPTWDDPFGIVVLEAAAAGLPVIASPFAGATTDLIEDGWNGFVIDPDDTGKWARALVDLATDPSLGQRLGARSYEATLTRTPARAAEGYAEAVQSALRRRRTQRLG
jgi:glycosyltransferase involved in cell wall biosynthesis